MRSKLFTILAGLAVLFGLGISAYAQGLTVYDPVMGTNPGVGSGSSCSPAAYACVSYSTVTSGTYAGDYKITVTAGGGSHDWDLASDNYASGAQNVFFFDGNGGSILNITASCDPGGNCSGTWGSTTNQTAGTFGVFSFAITAPKTDTDEIETLTFYYSGTLGTSFAAYVDDCGTAPPICAGDQSDPETICGYVSNPSSTVPEPGTLTLLGTGLISLAGFIRRRRAA